MSEKRVSAARCLYLIRRGPRPVYYRAPWHQVIVCAERAVARQEAGCTADLSDVWTKEADRSSGLLLLRWRGLDIDYGPIVRSMPLPDGSAGDISHARGEQPWTLLLSGQAVWWSLRRRAPVWLSGLVSTPTDSFSVERIRTCESDVDEWGLGQRRTGW